MWTKYVVASWVVLLFLVGNAAPVGAEELDSRVRHRLESIQRYLERAEKRLEAGNPGSVRSSLDAARREWRDLDRYKGKFDPQHPDVVAVRTRMAAIEARLESGAAGPSRQGVDGARHFLEKLEDLVRQAGGSPFDLGATGKEALARVRRLKEAHPDHAAIEELFQRTRVAFKASQGATMDITPDMVAYRRIQKELEARFEKLAVAEWTALREQVLASGKFVEKPWPPADPRETDIDEVIGKWVVLEDFAYPQNEFSFIGTQYVYLGSPSRGYYYVLLSCRAWSGTYEAIRRYRREVAGELPQEVKWTVVGKITGVHVLIPQAGEEKRMNAQIGWAVEPVAIRVPGYTFAVFDPESEVGGHFAGEDRLKEIKDAFYTVKEIPPAPTPQELFAVYRAAIKEKNLQLFLECIDPARKKTPAALQRAAYHWDLHQKRFAEFYVHSVVDRVDIRTARGYDVNSDDGAFFLTPEERAELEARAGPLLKRATVWLKAFDERGRQRGRPHPLYMRQYGKDRWVVEDASWPL